MQCRVRDRVALCYHEEGDGDPPLLFVHGLGCDHTDFARQIEYFRHRHRVVAVDLRGHGRLSAWESFATWDSVAALAACHTPLLYLDFGTPNCKVGHLRALHPALIDGRTMGAGHWAMLEVPEQVSALLDRFIAITAREESTR